MKRKIKLLLLSIVAITVLIIRHPPWNRCSSYSLLSFWVLRLFFWRHNPSMHLTTTGLQLISQKYFEDYHKPHTPEKTWTIWNEINNIHAPPITNKIKVVLYYTKWFEMDRFSPAGLLPMDSKTYMFKYPNGAQCEHKCRFTYDKQLLDTADAVIFHSKDITDMSPDIHSLSKQRRNLKQRWIFQTQESSYYSGKDASNFNGIFNWTMSYRTDADSPYTYFEYYPLTPDEASKVDQKVNYAAGKSNLIAWSVSHCCVRSRRDEVVHKLSQFVPIIINGKCEGHFPYRQYPAPSCGKRRSPECNRFYKSTKFYIAFENAMCEDYITEKYAETPLEHGMIPIVFGPQEYYQKLAIPGSYINLFDFPSIEALASYIKYLDKNDTAYNEYFQWRTKYKILADRANYACLLCQKLHDDSLPSKVYNDLGALHGHAQCDKNLEKIEKYL